MGRIGRSYPRFDEPRSGAPGPGEDTGTRRLQLAGAAIGVLAALALIGWVLTR
jgi:hypothetical protein